MVFRLQLPYEFRFIVNRTREIRVSSDGDGDGLEYHSDTWLLGVTSLSTAPQSSLEGDEKTKHCDIHLNRFNYDKFCDRIRVDRWGILSTITWQKALTLRLIIPPHAGAKVIISYSEIWAIVSTEADHYKVWNRFFLFHWGVQLDTYEKSLKLTDRL